MNYDIGVDIGSVSINCMAVDGNGPAPSQMSTMSVLGLVLGLDLLQLPVFHLARSVRV